jgi:hypothetical protein
MIEEAKIMGYTLQNWVEMLDCEEGENVEKALDYYDGDQYEEMEELLNCPHKGRKNWKERGIIPRFRNLTQMVVEKSGKLFKDNPPVVSIYDDNSKEINLSASELLMNELDKSDWLEFFNNLDSTVRLVKTCMVLVQFDIVDKSLCFEMLHRGNSAVIMDSTMKNILAIIYKTSEIEGVETYRIINAEEYIDLIEVEDDLGNSRVSISSRLPNPYGTIPVTVFHDTRKPRTGFWNKPGMDIISINELYNLHLTDSEYAISWNKLPTLFTNCNFADSTSTLELAVAYGQKLPHLQQGASELIGGPSRVIQLDSQGVDSPFIEYKSPDINLKPLDEIVTNWIDQFASDWSVKLTTNINTGGRANSGFQLIVEEIPNRELRQQRSKMFASGFKRLYRIIAQVLNIQYGREVLPLLADCFIEFTKLELPTDPLIEQQTWELMINSNRASVIDYLIETKGLTELEAVEKADEIVMYNDKYLRNAMKSDLNAVQSVPNVVNNSPNGVIDNINNNK